MNLALQLILPDILPTQSWKELMDHDETAHLGSWVLIPPIDQRRSNNNLNRAERRSRKRKGS
jgi:hypothetical protein